MEVRFNIAIDGAKGGVVQGKEAGLIGFYELGKPYKPDNAAVRALLPYKWRAAFDRGGTWWKANDDKLQTMWCDVYAARGRRRLTTIYANGFVGE